MIRASLRNASILLLLGVTASSAVAAGQIESRPIQFAKGASSATIKDSVKGDQTIDYKLRARAGQSMSVKLKSSNPSNYFNVLPPGSPDVAIFVGSSGGNEWSGSLEADGEYTVRVYLMRNAARRNEAASYMLTVAVTGTPSTAAVLGTAPAADAKVKGTPYHATGKVPCYIGSAPGTPVQCDFGVIRGKPGNAELHVRPPGGLERVLTFIDGKVTAPDSNSLKVSKANGVWSIEVNDVEHYEIPESVVFGG
jgi:hypothetical protein